MIISFFVRIPSKQGMHAGTHTSIYAVTNTWTEFASRVGKEKKKKQKQEECKFDCLLMFFQDKDGGRQRSRSPTY